jgi:hypothetical protein
MHVVGAAIIFVSWMPVIFAAGEETPTTFASTVLVRVTKAPVVVCAGTIPRTTRPWQ